MPRIMTSAFTMLCCRLNPCRGRDGPHRRFAAFTDQIDRFRFLMEQETPIEDVIEEILSSTGYREELMEEGEVEANARLENIDELVNKAASYSEEAEEPTLSGFLEEVALVADVDSVSELEDRVVLMTLTCSKRTGVFFRLHERHGRRAVSQFPVHFRKRRCH